MSDQFVIMILIIGAVATGVWGICNVFSGSEKTNDPSSDLPWLFRFSGPGIFFFSGIAGGFLERLFPSFSEKIQECIKKAALPIEVKDMYGAYLFFGICGGLIGIVLPLAFTANPAICLLTFLLFGFICGVYPNIYINRLARKREEEILRNLPFAIDLIASSMNAGLDFGSSVRYLLSIWKNNNILKKEFNIFLGDVELGKTRSEALKDMQNRVNIIEFTRFVTAISYGIDSGVSILETMRIQAEEMRRIKYARAEQKAAKAPVKMILPMVLFIFPSMFIIIAVAIYLRVKDSGVLHMIGK